jgi:hypothetical protein
MSRVSHLIMQLSYIAGVASIALVLLLVFVPGIAGKLHLTPRGGLIFASTLFVCTIASYLVGKAGDKS